MQARGSASSMASHRFAAGRAKVMSACVHAGCCTVAQKVRVPREHLCVYGGSRQPAALMCSPGMLGKSGEVCTLANEFERGAPQWCICQDSGSRPQALPAHLPELLAIWLSSVSSCCTHGPWSRQDVASRPSRFLVCGWSFCVLRGGCVCVPHAGTLALPLPVPGLRGATAVHVCEAP
jgi:hypothetical protein